MSDHEVVITQHWATSEEQAIIVECARCGERTFVGYGVNVPEAEKAAQDEHDQWVRAGSSSSTPQGVEMLYSKLGLSSGRR